MVSSVVDCMQGIQQHAFHCAHTCDPTHSTHSPRRWQEASPTGAEHVVDSWCAWPPTHTRRSAQTLCISVFPVQLHQEDHVHGSRQVVWRGHTNALGYNGGKSSFQQDGTMGCMHTITDNQAWHQLTTFTIISMSKSWSHHNRPSVSDVLHGLLKPFCITWAHVHCNVMLCQVEFQVSIVGCNSHRVDEESWG